MDIEATLKELGVDKPAAKVVGPLPLVYVAWADGKIQKAEREQIMHAASELGWLENGGEAVLDRWLTTRPTAEQVQSGVSLLNHFAKDHAHEHLDADDLHLLLLLCKDVADAAGGFLGITRAQ